MNALIIALAIVLGLVLLLLLLILLGRAKIRIICQGKIRVIASIYGIRFTLYSDRPKKKRLVHRCDDPDKILARELRRQKRALRKKQKKLVKKLKKKQTKKNRQARRGQPDPNPFENLQMIQALIKKLYTLTRGAVRIKVRRMHIYIGTEDAAKTAVTYGMVVHAASCTLELIDTCFTKIRRKDGAMKIVPNFLSETTTSDIDISASISLQRAVSIGLGMYSAYKAERRLALAKARARVLERDAQNQENNK